MTNPEFTPVQAKTFELISLATRALAENDAAQFGDANQELVDLLYGLLRDMDNASFFEEVIDLLDTLAESYPEEADKIYDEVEYLIGSPDQEIQGKTTLFDLFTVGISAPGLDSPRLTDDQLAALESFFKKTGQIEPSATVRFVPTLISLDDYANLSWPGLFTLAQYLAKDKKDILGSLTTIKPSDEVYVLMGVISKSDDPLTSDPDESPFQLDAQLTKATALLDPLANANEYAQFAQIVEVEEKAVKATSDYIAKVLGINEASVSNVLSLWALDGHELMEFRLITRVNQGLKTFIGIVSDPSELILENAEEFNDDLTGCVHNVYHKGTGQLLGTLELTLEPRLFMDMAECLEFYHEYFMALGVGIAEQD